VNPFEKPKTFLPVKWEVNHARCQVMVSRSIAQYSDVYSIIVTATVSRTNHVSRSPQFLVQFQGNVVG
jgi:hypothetical protein